MYVKITIREEGDIKGGKREESNVFAWVQEVFSHMRWDVSEFAPGTRGEATKQSFSHRSL